MKFQMKKFITLLAVIIMWAGPIRAQGPVVLGGDDLTGHGAVVGGVPVNGWKYIQLALANIRSNVTRPGPFTNDIAALGSADAPGFPSGDAGGAIGAAAMANGLSVNYYDGAPAITGFFDDLVANMTNPAIIWIAGSDAANDLEPAEGAVLTMKATQIAAFVNSGGGLMCHGFGNITYGWLFALFPAIDDVNSGNFGDLVLTPAGTVFLSPLTNAEINTGPWHNHFEGDFGNLEVLVRSTLVTDSQGDSAAVIIGGAEVILEPESRFEYAAKIICGTQKDPEDLRLARGRYATTINIHNPNNTKVEFLKKLALTFPPKEQRPGRVDTLGTDKLAPDEALKTDCMDIQERLFPNGFDGYIEGFVIIQSPMSLDVTAVYSSADPKGKQVRSIDIEQIRERKIETPPPEEDEEPEELDHFKVYKVDINTPVDFGVLLTGQFDDQAKEGRLIALTHFANPTSKVHGGSRIGIKDPNRHLNWYALAQEQQEPRRTVDFHNQFGQHKVDIKDSRVLLVPAQKTSDGGSVFPDSLDHYKCYDVIEVSLAPNLPAVTLDDQFGLEKNVQVLEPRYFCVPVKKELPGVPPHDIVNTDDHLTIYNIPPKPTQQQTVSVLDQFGERTLVVLESVMLAVPTEKQKVVTHKN